MNRVTSPPSASASKAARLAGYLAGGVGSTLLATPAADAAIVVVDVSTIGWTQGGTPGTGIGGTSAGITFGDAKKIAASFISHGGAVASMDIYNTTNRIGFDPDGNMQMATDGGSSSPHKFSTGQTINAASYSWRATAGDTAFIGGATATSPDFGAGSFVGFRFGSGSTYYYGYIEVTWAYNGSQAASTFSILSMAYESTANTGIVATSASAVPAGGGSMALMALGGGAFRRRGRAA